MEFSTIGQQPPSPERRTNFPFLAIAVVVLSAGLWTASLVLPVWETRSNNGEWALVNGNLPAVIGFLGILVWCPAWFANLLLIPSCVTLFKGKRVGFWLSVVGLAIALSAYWMPGIYGDNDEAVIVGRRIGFYLWLASFLLLVLAHAFLAKPMHRPSARVRAAAIALILVFVLVLEHAFHPHLSPLETSLEDPDDVAAFTAVLARNPSQAEKDAALPWVLRTDVSHSRGGVIRTQRLEQLIGAGANVNQSDRYGSTPMMEAVRIPGAEPAVRLLVRAGAKVNARDHRGKTILDIADEYHCSPECRQILLDAGAINSVQSKMR